MGLFDFIFGPKIEKMKNNNDIDGLIETLGHKNYKYRNSASKALVDIGDEAVKSLIQVLDSEDPVAQFTVSYILGDIKDKRAVEPLIYHLESEYNSVRLAAVNALGKISDDRAVEPLIQMVNDKDENCLLEIITAFGNIGDEKVVELLMSFLKIRDSNVRESAAAALAKRKEIRAAEQIIDYLFNRSSLTSELSLGLFGSYGRLIYDVSGLRSEVYSSQVRPYIMGSDLYSESNEAIRKLCAINTPISSNILHKVTQMEDFYVEVNIRVSEAQSMHNNFGMYEDRSCSSHKDWGFYLQEVSFKNLRTCATKELERRGNPSYDSSAYLEEGAWKLG